MLEFCFKPAIVLKVTFNEDQFSEVVPADA